MPRTFDGVDDVIAFSVGASNVAFGTYAVIIDKAGGDATAQSMCHLKDSGTGRWNLGLDSSNRIAHRGVNSTLTVTAAQSWQFIAVTKGTGTVTPRAHRYLYDTNAWTHENMSGTLADNSTASTIFRIGAEEPGFLHFNGSIGACCVIPVSLSDAAIESMAYSLKTWYQESPSGLWLLDQDATSQKVPDITGKGANESSITGTAVGTSSIPVFSYGNEVD